MYKGATKLYNYVGNQVSDWLSEHSEAKKIPVTLVLTNVLINNAFSLLKDEILQVQKDKVE
jgi:6,7-dimethyl-8-ribityllumazine synthase